jgi:hypothetical protein
MEQTVRKKASEDISNTHGCPKPAKAKSELMVFVKVRQIEDDVWNKASLQDTKQRATRKEACTTREPELSACDD